jgi:hypothetical protein
MVSPDFVPRTATRSFTSFFVFTMRARTLRLPASSKRQTSWASESRRRWDNQFARVEQAAEASPHFRVFHGAGPQELAQAAREFLRDPMPKQNPVTADGARKAAECIYDLLRRARPGARAKPLKKHPRP